MIDLPELDTKEEESIVRKLKKSFHKYQKLHTKTTF